MILLKRLRYLPALFITVLAFISCDDDFNTIGGELIGGQQAGLPHYESEVVAYNKRVNPVQTNNLADHLLGVYNEPVYGQHTANVLSQLSFPAGVGNPSFGNEPRLDSVVLSLPYYSTALEADEQGNATYRLDSIYGNAPFKLTIARSNYFLNEYDPAANFESRQRYYSDMDPDFRNSLVGEPIYENEAFVPSNRPVTYRVANVAGEVDTVTVSPRMRVHLPLDFFQENILDREGSSVLFNNNNFRNFMRGFYFMAEPVNGNGSMMLLNFTHSDAGITLYYTNTVEQEGEEVEVENSFRFGFGPNIVNTFSQEWEPSILQEIADSNEPPGADRLFLRGGEGSMAIVELFQDQEELEELRERSWLINEASLTFYVDQEWVDNGRSEPNRIYLYNLESNELLVDYARDQTASAENPANALISHSPVMVRDENGNGLYYRIRITEHVRAILLGATEPVRLGLVVIQNPRIVANAYYRTPTEDVSRVPSGALITPKGTVLHGNLSSNPAKRLKLDIYYTETRN